MCFCWFVLKISFVIFRIMASKRERTAYIYCVPEGTSESMLSSALNKNNQSDYSIHIHELKRNVVVVKIFGNGLYYVICLIIMNFCM